MYFSKIIVLFRMHLLALPGLELDFDSQLAAICGFSTNTLTRLIEALASKGMSLVYLPYYPCISEATGYRVIKPAHNGCYTSVLDNFT